MHLKLMQQFCVRMRGVFPSQRHIVYLTFGGRPQA
jgi:hypothetical protein